MAQEIEIILHLCLKVCLKIGVYRILFYFMTWLELFQIGYFSIKIICIQKVYVYASLKKDQVDHFLSL